MSKKLKFILTGVLLSLSLIITSIFSIIFVKNTFADEKFNNQEVETGANAQEEGSSVEDEDINLKGGAIYIGDNQTFILDKGIISGHENKFGGAIYIASGGTFIMNGGTISGNTAMVGGAIFIENGGTCILNGGEIKDNIASISPAIYSQDDGNLEIADNFIIRENRKISLRINYVVDDIVADSVSLFPNKLYFSLNDAPFGYEESCGYFLDQELTKSIEIGDVLSEYSSDSNNQAMANPAGILNVYTKKETISEQQLDIDVETGYKISVTDVSQISSSLVFPKVITKNDKTLYVTSIGSFEGSNQLTNVALPSNITEIPVGAFSSCANLKQINLHNNLKTIETSAFYNSPSLEKIIIPDSVTELGSEAFMDCLGIAYVKLGGGLTNVPENAFRNCLNIETLIVNDNISLIESNAFTGCNNIEHLEIGSGLGAVDLSKIFSNATTLNSVKNKLEKISLNNNIPARAFANLSNLKDVTIGENVLEIGEDAFDGSSNIIGLEIKNLEKWVSINFETPKSNPMFYAGDNNVFINGDEECSTKVDLSNLNTVAIRKYVFYNYSKLENVIIGDSCRINEQAFENVENIKSLEIGTNLKNDKGNELLVSSELFGGCENLEMLKINSKEVNSFENKKKLKSVVIGDSVESILVSAFRYCTNIESFVVDENNAYYSSGNGANAILTKDLKKLRFGCKTTIIPDVTESLNGSSFANFDLEEIIIPKSVKTIHSNAFVGCYNINCLKIESLDSWFNIDFYNLESNPMLYAKEICVYEPSVGLYQQTSEFVVNNDSLKKYSLAGNQIKTLILSDNVTSIDANAVGDNVNLENLSIGSGFASVNKEMFNGCEQLKSLETKSFISDSGFSGLQHLTQVSLYVNVGDYAFNDCLSLNTITINSGLTNIGQYAFNGCLNVENIISESLEIWLNITFGDNTKASDNFRANPMYDSNKETLYIVNPSEGDLVPLTELVVPQELTKVNPCAFIKYEKLEKLRIHDNVSSLEAWSFAGCKSLNEIVVSENNPTYSSGTNANAVLSKDLKTLYIGCKDTIIPNTTETIVSGAFSYKNTIRELTLPSSIKTLETAFYRCENDGIEQILNIESLDSWFNIDFAGSYANPMGFADIIRVKNQETGVYEQTTSFTVNVENIKRFALKGSQIKTLTLSDNVKTLEDRAIEAETGIENLTIGSGLTNVHKDMFGGCSYLKSLTINTTMAKEAFKDVSTLEILNLNDAITDIPDYAFSGCSSLSGTIKTIKIGNYAQSSSVKGLHLDNIRTIGVQAFYNCNSITDIVVGEHLVSIGERAFGYYHEPDPETPDRLYYDIKLDGNSIKNVYIKSLQQWQNVSLGLTTVYVMGKDSQVTSNIPYSNPLSYAENMYVGVWNGENNENFVSYQKTTTIELTGSAVGNGLFYHSPITTLVLSLTPTNNNLTIGENAFANCKGLTKIDMTKSEITELKEGTFSDCSYVKEIIFPKTIKIIGERAFANSSITTLTLPEGLERIEHRAFRSCSNLSGTIIIPSTVTFIGQHAFDYGKKIKEIIILTGMQYDEVNETYVTDEKGYLVPDENFDKEATIYQFGLSKLSGLEKIWIPSCYTLQQKIFYSDAKDTLPPSHDPNEFMIYTDALSTPSTWRTTAGSEWNNDQYTKKFNGFDYCYSTAFGSKLKAVKNEDGKIISFKIEKGYIIDQNKQLISGGIYLDEDNTILTIPENVTSVGANAFGDNYVETLVIPDCVTEIDNFAFFTRYYDEENEVWTSDPNYYTLKEIVYDGNILWFAGCSNVNVVKVKNQNITLDEFISEFENVSDYNGFAGCWVVSIDGEYKVFTKTYGNGSQDKPYLISDVLHFKNLMNKTYSTNNVVYYKLISDIDLTTIDKFNSISETSISIDGLFIDENGERCLTIYGFDESRFTNGYMINNAYNSTIKNIIFQSNSTPAKVVNNDATNNLLCENMSINANTTLIKYSGSEKEYTIPEKIETIADGAFMGNTTIEKIIFPESFGGVQGKSVNASNGAYIGANAFKNCVNLREIVFEANILPEISANAFDGCVNLTRIKTKNLEITPKQLRNSEWAKMNVDSENGMSGDWSPTYDRESGYMLFTKIYGDGTENNPYLIENTEQCKNFIDEMLEKIVITYYDSEGNVVETQDLNGYSIHDLLTVRITRKYNAELLDFEIIDFEIYNTLYFKLIDDIDISSVGLKTIGNASVVLDGLYDDGYHNEYNFKVLGFNQSEFSGGALLYNGYNTKISNIDFYATETPADIIVNDITNNFICDNVYIYKDSELYKYYGSDKELVIKESVTTIGEEAFDGNSLIEKVVIHSAVVEIKANAFLNCINLKEIVFKGTTLPVIDNSAFTGCLNLETIKTNDLTQDQKVGNFMWAELEQTSDFATAWIASVSNGTITYTKTTGDGTENNPYLIKEFKPEMLENLGAYWKL